VYRDGRVKVQLKEGELRKITGGVAIFETGGGSDSGGGGSTMIKDDEKGGNYVQLRDDRRGGRSG